MSETKTPTAKPGYTICKRCNGTGYWRPMRQCYGCAGQGENEIQTASVKVRDLNAKIELTLDAIEFHQKKGNTRAAEAYIKSLADLRAKLAKLV